MRSATHSRHSGRKSQFRKIAPAGRALRPTRIGDAPIIARAGPASAGFFHVKKSFEASQCANQLGAGWAQLLAKDYCDPRYHISFARAIGRRLRRTYAWIFRSESGQIPDEDRTPPLSR